MFRIGLGLLVGVNTAMKLRELHSSFINESLNVTTEQEASDRGLFGPVYHGSSPENLANIRKDGFRVIRSGGDKSHGYPDEEYGSTGYPPPVDHLGFGVYFTTVKSIGKKFNNNSVRGLVKFYLDVPRLEDINFGVPKTMMKWWIANGYNIDEGIGQIKATENLTTQLSSRYDAVWFKGKGMYTLLDGDQVCVYDPTKIYVVDNSSVSGFDLGATVMHSGKVPRRYEGREDSYFIPPAGMKGKIVSKNHIPFERWNDDMLAKMHLDPSVDKNWVSVKWKKGGVHSSYTESDLVSI